MTREEHARVTPIVAETAQRLQTWLEGATTLEDAIHVVGVWAQESGARRASNGVSGKVWVGNEVVVKANYLTESIRHIPPQYRPEEVVVWEGDYDRIVVQPRYTPIVDEFSNPIGDRLQLLRETLPNYGWVSNDSHIGNWGLRPDGTPVLFDW